MPLALWHWLLCFWLELLSMVWIPMETLWSKKDHSGQFDPCGSNYMDKTLTTMDVRSKALSRDEILVVLCAGLWSPQETNYLHMHNTLVSAYDADQIGGNSFPFLGHLWWETRKYYQVNSVGITMVFQKYSWYCLRDPHSTIVKAVGSSLCTMLSVDARPPSLHEAKPPFRRRRVHPCRVASISRSCG